MNDFNLDRRVGTESMKSYRRKIADGFFAKYLSGESILEVGYKGYGEGALPIVPRAIGIDLDYPGYDGVRLPFPDDSQDAVYSSHCLEHIENYRDVLRDWFRVVKPGGFLIIIVPHQFLYERRAQYPASGVYEHKRFYTPASLLGEIEELLEPNAYRVRYLADNDADYNYAVLAREDLTGCFEIELVLEKINKPVWSLEDGSSRIYPAAEFFTHGSRKGPRPIETDFSVSDRCLVWGPYVPLAGGDYEVRFFWEVEGLERRALASPIELDVARDRTRVASTKLSGADGTNVLLRGEAALRFHNEASGALFEFRVFTSGKPFAGSFRFFGVGLERVYGA